MFYNFSTPGEMDLGKVSYSEEDRSALVHSSYLLNTLHMVIRTHRRTSVEAKRGTGPPLANEIFLRYDILT
jgi:hypothetical protein